MKARSLLAVLIVLMVFATESKARVLNPGLGRWLSRDPLGMITGASLYEYGAATPVSSLDPSGLVITTTRCTDCLNWCWKSDPVVIQLRFACNTHGTYPTPDQGVPRSAVSCANCSGSDGGFTSCAAGTPGGITICANNNYTCDNVCRVLAHELVHYCDDVRLGHCISKCYEEACSEIRAMALSGQCCPGRGWALPGESYSDCVRRNAKTSTSGFGCSPDLVDQQFARCYPSASELPICGTMVPIKPAVPFPPHIPAYPVIN
jgi:hypothetical protein